LAEGLAPRLGEQQLQPLHFERANLRFALRDDARRLLLLQQLALREDQRMRAREV
jgi:hypothetical protein